PGPGSRSGTAPARPGRRPAARRTTGPRRWRPARPRTPRGRCTSGRAAWTAGWGWSSECEPSRVEEADGLLGPVLGHQPGHDLAHHRHELEPVPGEAAGDHDPLVSRVPGDDEVLVRRVGVHAGLAVAQ